MNGFALARFDCNNYSVPFQYAGKDITVKGYGRRIEFIYNHEIIAKYERDYRKNQTHYQLDHYIELIERRPRSVYNAAPVRATVPDDLYDYLLKIEDPKIVLIILKSYLQDNELVMFGIRNGYNNQQLIAHIESAGNDSKFKPNISVSVNRADLSQYDELIRRGCGS